MRVCIVLPATPLCWHAPHPAVNRECSKGSTFQVQQISAARWYIYSMSVLYILTLQKIIYLGMYNLMLIHII